MGVMFSGRPRFYPRNPCAREREEERDVEDLQIGHDGDPSSLLARAKRAGSENGGVRVGDERSGRFSHEMVGGEYRMVGRTVTVTEKHWLVPWTVAESQLRALFQ